MDRVILRDLLQLGESEQWEELPGNLRGSAEESGRGKEEAEERSAWTVKPDTDPDINSKFKSNFNLKHVHFVCIHPDSKSAEEGSCLEQVEAVNIVKEVIFALIDYNFEN